MTLTRRQFLDRSACAFVAAGFALHAVPALAESVDIEALMQPSPLSEMALGKEDAPITVVEYASMTCGHCANFHKNTYPHLIKEYVDTGKVRFIMREFPLDPVATAGFMLARCAPEEKYFSVIETMFHEQKAWAFTNDPYNSHSLSSNTVTALFEELGWTGRVRFIVCTADGWGGRRPASRCGCGRG